MKKIIGLVFLGFIIGKLGAIDTESYQFIDHLLALKGPGSPEVYEDAVIFTAPSSNRRVGIAFAHEGFSKVYWFQKLMVSRNEETEEAPNDKKLPPPYQDSGILFYVFTIPENLRELEYRLIIDGLWTVDPLNPLRRTDQRSGIAHSMVALPEIQRPPSVLNNPPGSLSFTYSAPPGETVTVAGSFNRWDPFMYELQEKTPGVYSLTIPLPPGVYHYAFFHRGERILDPHNSSRAYTREGMSASEAVVN
jgi:hypothetical protein